MDLLAREFGRLMKIGRRLRDEFERDPLLAPAVVSDFRNIVTYFPDERTISPQVVLEPFERNDNARLMTALSTELSRTPEFERIKEWVAAQPDAGKYSYQGVEMLVKEVASRALARDRSYADVLRRFRLTISGRPFLNTVFQAVYGVSLGCKAIEIRKNGAAIKFGAATPSELQAGADRVGSYWQGRAVPAVSIFCFCRYDHPFGGPTQSLEELSLKLLGLYRVGWIVPCFSMFWSDALLYNGGLNVGTPAHHGFGTRFEISEDERAEFEAHCTKLWRPLQNLEDNQSGFMAYIHLAYRNYIKSLGEYQLREKNISDVMVAFDGLLVGRNENKLDSLKSRIPLLCDLCETNQVFDGPALKKLLAVSYDVRSRIFHGDPQDHKLWEKLECAAAPFGGITTLFDICRRCLLISAALGLPKDKLIEKLVRAQKRQTERTALQRLVRAKVGRISSLSRPFPSPALNVRKVSQTMSPESPGEGWRMLKVGDILGQ